MIGIKVSQQGYDIASAANKNLTFSSELATHSIYAVVDVNIPNGTLESDAVTHNLGYVPKVWVYQYNSSSFLNRIPVITGVSTGTDFYITDTVVHIKKTSALGTGTFKVIIFTRSANP